MLNWTLLLLETPLKEVSWYVTVSLKRYKSYKIIFKWCKLSFSISQKSGGGEFWPSSILNWTDLCTSENKQRSRFVYHTPLPITCTAICLRLSHSTHKNPSETHNVISVTHCGNQHCTKIQKQILFSHGSISIWYGRTRHLGQLWTLDLSEYYLVKLYLVKYFSYNIETFPLFELLEISPADYNYWCQVYI